MGMAWFSPPSDLPGRLTWANEYCGKAAVVYGPTQETLEFLEYLLYNQYCIEINAILKEVIFMELAKITMRGQITIPVGIRRRLGVKDGDKVVFIEENGRVVIENAAMIALKAAQDAFTGEAERLDIKTEQDVVALVKEVRRELWEERHADNA